MPARKGSLFFLKIFGIIALISTVLLIINGARFFAFLSSAVIEPFETKESARTASDEVVDSTKQGGESPKVALPATQSTKVPRQSPIVAEEEFIAESAEDAAYREYFDKLQEYWIKKAAGLSDEERMQLLSVEVEKFSEDDPRREDLLEAELMLAETTNPPGPQRAKYVEEYLALLSKPGLNDDTITNQLFSLRSFAADAGPSVEDRVQRVLEVTDPETAAWEREQTRIFEEQEHRARSL